MFNKIQTFLLVTAAVLSMVGYFLCWKKKKTKTYAKVGNVRKLFFYPVKSIKGIEVLQVQCTSRGIEFDGIRDRSYMLVTGAGTLVSQRQEPRMILLTPSISENELHITGPEMETLKIPIKKEITPDEKLIDCKLFTDHSKGVDCGEEAAMWFNKYLKRSDLRFVRSALELPDRKYQRQDPFYTKLKKDHPVDFQDFSPFHLLSQASVDELNTKLETSISCKNFRPNILVDHCAAFDEDNWTFIKFSSGAEMFHVLPCGRCLLTTNDPETGIISKKDPLTTLRKFRMLKDKEMSRLIDHSPCFGTSCILEKPGIIRVGDDVVAVTKEVPLKF